MANPTAYAKSEWINAESYHQDGYIAVSNDGYTQHSVLPVNSIIKAFARTSAGVWTCTLQECWPASVTNAYGSPLVKFDITPVYPSDPGSSKLGVAVLSDNIATNTVPGSGVINFELLNSSGTLTDLPALGGFRFSIVLVNTNLYL